MKPVQDKALRSFVGNLLRIGVTIAMVIVIAGLVLFLFQYGKDTTHYETFNKNDVFRLPVFLYNLKHGDSKTIMQLGIMILIATPVARVLFTMIGFWLEQDYMYTIIALIVLCIIAFSLIMGINTH